MISHDLLAPLSLFRDFSPEQRAVIQGLMKPRDVTRGESLVIEGETSDALFIVLHGAFEVVRSGIDGGIAWIRAGEVVGEMGFFAGTPRTATVIATRDATVLELDRDGWEQAAREVPTLATSFLSVLARRLDHTSSRLSNSRLRPNERTIAVVHGGREPIPPLFFERLRNALTASGATVVDDRALRDRFGTLTPNPHDLKQWLNALEWENQLLVYFANPELTDWTRKCVRQADTVVIATRGEAPDGDSNPVESFVRGHHEASSRRLVRVHDQRTGVVTGTAAWLRRYGVDMHHHVALSDDESFHRLVRYLSGNALGFVAGGGGAFGPAHVGIYKAFTERGVSFDAFVGTSVGSAMTAGFAKGHDADYLDKGTHDIFVRHASFKKPTWPKYALLDHKAFDFALQEAYGEHTLIEDCWIPYCAVATNLSTLGTEYIRTGLLWKAVRASSAIPAVLPPVFREDGAMLVDGGVMDNAPLAPMQELKNGPNLVVHFGKSTGQYFNVDYDAIPGRWELLRTLLNPFSRRRLPRAPNPANVLMRSLFVHQNYDLPAGQHDLVLRPPPFPGSSFLDFDRHTEVFHASYEWAKETMEELTRTGDEALAALLEPASTSAAKSLDEAA